MFDILLRCETREAWLAWAVEKGILAYNDVDGSYTPQPDHHIDEVGHFVIKPAVYEGEPPNVIEVEPAVLDTWWRVNLRLTGDAADFDYVAPRYPGDAESPHRFSHSKLIASVRRHGTPKIAPGNNPAYETGVEPNRIQVIDGRELELRRIWLGGMSL